MALLDWINPFNKVADLISEVVTDKDEKNRLNHALEELKQQVYMQELQTKTVPWVDGLHKMGRQIISMTTVISGALLLHFNPDIELVKMASILGLGASPGAIYTLMKGRGK
jgi:hypothetical protein